MVYKGHIRNGVVVLDENIALPEGAVVDVVVTEAPAMSPCNSPPKTLLERLSGVVGKATDLPSDAARNVDHYLYGHPRQP